MSDGGTLDPGEQDDLERLFAEATEEQGTGQVGSGAAASSASGAAASSATGTATTTDALDGVPRVVVTATLGARAPHGMILRLLCSDPRLVHIEGFASEEETSRLLARAMHGDAWKRSGGGAADRSGSLAPVVHGRTSSWAPLGDACDDAGGELTAAVERAAWLTGLAAEHAEHVQVVHYACSEEYRHHLDHFTQRDADAERRMGDAGNRLVSVFLCLAAADEGGETDFPLVTRRVHGRRERGLRVALQPGDALLWHNLDKKGRPDARTLHAGCPVRAGRKVGMNIWLRQRPLKPPADDAPRGTKGGARLGPSAWPMPPAHALTTATVRAAPMLPERAA